MEKVRFETEPSILYVYGLGASLIQKLSIYPWLSERDGDNTIVIVEDQVAKIRYTLSYYFIDCTSQRKSLANPKLREGSLRLSQISYLIDRREVLELLLNIFKKPPHSESKEEFSAWEELNPKIMSSYEGYEIKGRIGYYRHNNGDKISKEDISALALEKLRSIFNFMPDMFSDEYEILAKDKNGLYWMYNTSYYGDIWLKRLIIAGLVGGIIRFDVDRKNFTKI